MPIYEYVCRDCGQELEVIQRFSDPPLVSCNLCSGRLEKKISISSFHLKGSGWYVTDYARKNSHGAASSGKNGDGGKEKVEKKSDTSDTKTAADSGTAKEKKSDSTGTTATVA